MTTATYIERRQPRDFGSQHFAIVDATEALRLRGATHFRVSVKAMTQEIMVEGWVGTPLDEGDFPL